MFQMLGHQLAVLFWKVVKTLQSGAQMEDVGRRDRFLRHCLPGPFSACSLLSVPHKVTLTHSLATATFCTNLWNYMAKNGHLWNCKPRQCFSFKLLLSGIPHSNAKVTKTQHKAEKLPP